MYTLSSKHIFQPAPPTKQKFHRYASYNPMISYSPLTPDFYNHPFKKLLEWAVYDAQVTLPQSLLDRGEIEDRGLTDILNKTKMALFGSPAGRASIGMCLHVFLAGRVVDPLRVLHQKLVIDDLEGKGAKVIMYNDGPPGVGHLTNRTSDVYTLISHKFPATKHACDVQRGECITNAYFVRHYRFLHMGRDRWELYDDYAEFTNCGMQVKAGFVVKMMVVSFAFILLGAWIYSYFHDFLDEL